MNMMASQITSLTIVYSTIDSGANQRKHQSFASLAFVSGIHRSPVNSPHKWPVKQKMFPFDDIVMNQAEFISKQSLDSQEAIAPIYVLALLYLDCTAK